MEVGSQEGCRREAGALVTRFPLTREGQWQSLLLLQSDMCAEFCPHNAKSPGLCGSPGPEGVGPQAGLGFPFALSGWLPGVFIPVVC